MGHESEDRLYHMPVLAPIEMVLIVIIHTCFHFLV